MKAYHIIIIKLVIWSARIEFVISDVKYISRHVNLTLHDLDIFKLDFLQTQCFELQHFTRWVAIMGAVWRKFHPVGRWRKVTKYEPATGPYVSPEYRWVGAGYIASFFSYIYIYTRRCNNNKLWCSYDIASLKRTRLVFCDVQVYVYRKLVIHEHCRRQGVTTEFVYYIL